MMENGGRKVLGRHNGEGDGSNKKKKNYALASKMHISKPIINYSKPIINYSTRQKPQRQRINLLIYNTVNDSIASCDLPQLINPIMINIHKQMRKSETPCLRTGKNSFFFNK